MAGSWGGSRCHLKGTLFVDDPGPRNILVLLCYQDLHMLQIVVMNMNTSTASFFFSQTYGRYWAQQTICTWENIMSESTFFRQASTFKSISYFLIKLPSKVQNWPMYSLPQAEVI